jgi:hypothetical protein
MNSRLLINYGISPEKWLFFSIRGTYKQAKHRETNNLTTILAVSIGIKSVLNASVNRSFQVWNNYLLIYRKCQKT